MDRDDTDASPGETSQYPPSVHGDSVEWAAIDAYYGRTPHDHEDEGPAR